MRVNVEKELSHAAEDTPMISAVTYNLPPGHDASAGRTSPADPGSDTEPCSVFAAVVEGELAGVEAACFFMSHLCISLSGSTCLFDRGATRQRQCCTSSVCLLVNGCVHAQNA